MKSEIKEGDRVAIYSALDKEGPGETNGLRRQVGTVKTVEGDTVYVAGDKCSFGTWAHIKQCRKLKKPKDIGYPAYKLKVGVFGMHAGTVFLFVETTNGYSGGRLKNALYKSNVQYHNGSGWLPGVFELPERLREMDAWFERIHNDGSYTL